MAPCQSDSNFDSGSIAASVGAGKHLASTGDNKSIGELISRPFKLTEGFASMLIGGSEHAEARVELVAERTGKVLAGVSGGGKDELHRATLDVVHGKAKWYAFDWSTTLMMHISCSTIFAFIAKVMRFGPACFRLGQQYFGFTRARNLRARRERKCCV